MPENWEPSPPWHPFHLAGGLWETRLCHDQPLPQQGEGWDKQHLHPHSTYPCRKRLHHSWHGIYWRHKDRVKGQQVHIGLKEKCWEEPWEADEEDKRAAWEIDGEVAQENASRKSGHVEFTPSTLTDIISELKGSLEKAKNHEDIPRHGEERNRGVREIQLVPQGAEAAPSGGSLLPPKPLLQQGTELLCLPHGPAHEQDRCKEWDHRERIHYENQQIQSRQMRGMPSLLSMLQGKGRPHNRSQPRTEWT